VLGNLDDLEVEKPKKIKKKVIIYKSDSDSDSEEEIIIKKSKPKKEKKIEQPILQNIQPVYRKVIKFI